VREKEKTSKCQQKIDLNETILMENLLDKRAQKNKASFNNESIDFSSIPFSPPHLQIQLIPPNDLRSTYIIESDKHKFQLLRTHSAKLMSLSAFQICLRFSFITVD
jgi:hypothetical protein